MLLTPVSKLFDYQTSYTLTIGTSAKSIDGFSVDVNKDSIGGDIFTLKFRTEMNPLGVKEIQKNIPQNFSLEQNYPNPFNPSTSIQFSLPEESDVTLKVFDVVGREAAELTNAHIMAGTYTASWNASSFASGMYFYKLTAKNYTSIKRVMLVK